MAWLACSHCLILFLFTSWLPFTTAHRAVFFVHFVLFDLFGALTAPNLVEIVSGKVRSFCFYWSHAQSRIRNQDQRALVCCTYVTRGCYILAFQYSYHILIPSSSYIPQWLIDDLWLSVVNLLLPNPPLLFSVHTGSLEIFICPSDDVRKPKHARDSYIFIYFCYTLVIFVPEAVGLKNAEGIFWTRVNSFLLCLCPLCVCVCALLVARDSSMMQ